jgi:hypothetical protein
MRALRVVLPALLVALVVGAGVAFFTTRPDLEHTESTVDRAWTPLASQLTTRYASLDQTDQKLTSLTGPVRDLANQVGVAYGAWQTARAHGDVAAQVRAANALEALGRRLLTAARSSQRVEANAAALGAVNQYAADPTFANATVLQSVDAYNRAVQDYERQRRGPVRGLVASLMGQNHIPAFAPAPA